MNPIATIKIENRGNIQIELYPQEAPNSVNSFIFMINNGVFNNQPIKRIVKNFIIQPSYEDFDNELAKYSIEGEFKVNNFDNNIVLEKNIVAFAGDGAKISSGSCFFFVMSNNIEKLKGKYSAFGKVIKGSEILEDIQNVDTFKVDVGVKGVVVNQPVTPEIIQSVTVEVFGIVYDKPKSLDITIY